MLIKRVAKGLSSPRNEGPNALEKVHLSPDPELFTFKYMNY